MLSWKHAGDFNLAPWPYWATGVVVSPDPKTGHYNSKNIYTAAVICATGLEARRIIATSHKQPINESDILWHACSEKPLDWEPFGKLGGRLTKESWMVWDNRDLLEALKKLPKKIEKEGVANVRIAAIPRYGNED